MKTTKPESVGISSERLARMDAFMQDQIDNKKTGGIIVLVARDGKIAHREAFGYGLGVSSTINPEERYPYVL